MNPETLIERAARLESEEQEIWREGWTEGWNDCVEAAVRVASNYECATSLLRRLRTLSKPTAAKQGENPDATH